MIESNHLTVRERKCRRSRLRRSRWRTRTISSRYLASASHSIVFEAVLETNNLAYRQRYQRLWASLTRVKLEWQVAALKSCPQRAYRPQNSVSWRLVGTCQPKTQQGSWRKRIKTITSIICKRAQACCKGMISMEGLVVQVYLWCQWRESWLYLRFPRLSPRPWSILTSRSSEICKWCKMSTNLITEISISSQKKFL